MPAKVLVRDLQKHYGPTHAVRGLSFNVDEGEIFGLLGPNGAGKTSTLECVIGLRQPDGGQIDVCGCDALKQPRKVRELIGAALQATYLQDKITCREALKLFGSFYARRLDPDTLLKMFSLEEKSAARFETLSGGQKQRLALALAMVNNPEFLLLDEPTSGLDPQSRRELHGVIRQMRADGRTVLLSTHYIEEAELLCDRIAIVDHGTIIAEGTPQTLVANAKTPTRIIVTTAQPMDLTPLRGLPCVVDASTENGTVVLGTKTAGETVVELVRYVERSGNELLDLHIKKPSLEDVFIEMTGRRIRD